METNMYCVDFVRSVDCPFHYGTEIATGLIMEKSSFVDRTPLYD